MVVALLAAILGAAQAQPAALVATVANDPATLSCSTQCQTTYVAIVRPTHNMPLCSQNRLSQCIHASQTPDSYRNRTNVDSVSASSLSAHFNTGPPQVNSAASGACDNCPSNTGNQSAISGFQNSTNTNCTTCWTQWTAYASAWCAGSDISLFRSVAR